VVAGDTLPELARQVYGSETHYLWLARQNQLDDFRNLQPGRVIHFPPLPAEAR
jgi:nucleoid-associated protein YgaU